MLGTVKHFSANPFSDNPGMLRSKEKAALARRITDLVKSSPLSRRVIAEQAGVADGLIGNIMYGKGNPTLDTLVKLATYFRTPLVALLDTRTVPLPAAEPVATYGSGPEETRVLSVFRLLTTADQQEFIAAMEDRAARNSSIFRELASRNSSATVAYGPAVPDQEVAEKMRLKTPSR